MRPQLSSHDAWVPTGEEASPQCLQRHRPERPGSADPTSCLVEGAWRGLKSLSWPPLKSLGDSEPNVPPSAAQLAWSAGGQEGGLKGQEPAAGPGAGGGGARRAGPGGRRARTAAAAGAAALLPGMDSYRAPGRRSRWADTRGRVGLEKSGQHQPQTTPCASSGANNYRTDNYRGLPS